MLRAPGDFAGDDSRYWAAAKVAAIEGRVARATGRIGGAVCPGAVGGENRDVGGAALGELSAVLFPEAEDTRGTRAE